MFRKWADLNSGKDDKLTRALIIAQTKACPTCKVRWGPPIACLHVTCHKDKGGCGAEWCWLCKGDYKTHTNTYYSCAKYVPKKEVDPAV